MLSFIKNELGCLVSFLIAVIAIIMVILLVKFVISIDFMQVGTDISNGIKNIVNNI